MGASEGCIHLTNNVRVKVDNDLNNMNPYPYDGTGLVQLHSPMLVQGKPTGEDESDTDSFAEPSDLREQWDKIECGDWSCCPTLPLGEGPTWAEATAEMRRKVIVEKDTPTSEDVIHSSPQKKNTEKEDSDWDEDTHITVESQFEDAAVVVETCRNPLQNYCH